MTRDELIQLCSTAVVDRLRRMPTEDEVTLALITMDTTLAAISDELGHVGAHTTHGALALRMARERIQALQDRERVR